MSQRIHCPNPECPWPEDVQNVRVIMAGVTRYVSVPTSHAITITSALGEQLAPPVPPPEVQWRFAEIAWIVGLALFGMLAFVEAAGGIADPAYCTPSRCLRYLPTVAGLFLLGVASIAAVARIVIHHQVAAAKYDKWLSRKEIWDQLYYCNHCGSVFNPNDESTFVPASRMNELLGVKVRDTSSRVLETPPMSPELNDEPGDPRGSPML